MKEFVNAQNTRRRNRTENEDGIKKMKNNLRKTLKTLPETIKESI